MEPVKTDLQNRADIETLINAFYYKVKQDDLIGPFFADISFIDWDHHLPLMYGFWEFILFSKDGAYTGNVMAPHIRLNQKKQMLAEHFERWLKLFNETVDGLFEGAKADDIKTAAFNIGMTMKYKILGSSGRKFDIKVTKQE